MKRVSIYIWLWLCCLWAGCAKYLDVVPDNVATIENAFTSRTTAEKFLFTCYSYLPAHADPDAIPFLAADEFWLPYPQVPQFYANYIFEGIAMSNQSVISPQMNYWDGGHGGKPLFRALRDCNIFLENMPSVPGMQQRELRKWMAEVKFLKAYYHYWLVRMYGPIPIMRTNMDISAGVEEVQVKREPVDSCFSYIVQLLDEAAPDLPEVMENENSELGRISRPGLLAIKANILVEAASPLFNGNPDFGGLKNPDGQQLFSTTPDDTKWEKAAAACKAAVEACHAQGMKLYKYNPAVVSNQLSDTTITQMSIRNAVAEKWNSEIVWGNTNSMADEIQRLSQARVDPTRTNNLGARSLLAPTLEMAELFYTKNGVPINEDLSWDYANRFELKTADDSHRFNIIPGYQTAALHFDREDRFYADMGFDGGIWYGQGKFDDREPWSLKAKFKQHGGKSGISLYSVTGYWPKKLVHFQNVIEPGDGGKYTVVPYPWPVMRLANLYLLYAEALNESKGPVPEALHWANEVRARAGLPTIETAWTTFSRMPSKHTTKEGLRSILQQERLIELAFEGQRFWDARRWKRAVELFNTSIQGWDIAQEDAKLYYRVKTLYTRKFTSRDYFWPISENNLIVNRNIVQNPGW